ncbi:MAG: hypothetical protein PVJ67_02010 [Candidatus Pacearchaeota archaeon]|jgi:hypothetical protein
MADLLKEDSILGLIDMIRQRGAYEEANLLEGLYLFTKDQKTREYNPEANK